MSDDSGAAAATAGEQETWLGYAVGSGVVLSLLGAAAGLLMVLDRRERSCPDGTYFPQGETDFRCFVHPRAFEGVGLLVVSLMLGILVVLGGVVVRRLGERAPAPAAAPDRP